MKKIAATLLAFASLSANAISVYEGKITALLSGPNYNSILYIQIDKNAGSVENEVANCDNPEWDYIIDTSTENGKFYASMVLSAYMGDKTVNIQGYPECQGNVELLRHIMLK